jgi:hypothetical protein
LNQTNLGILSNALPVPATTLAVATPAPVLQQAATGTTVFSGLLAQQFASLTDGEPLSTGSLPGQFAALFAQQGAAPTTQAQAGLTSTDEAGQAAALLGNLLALLQQLLAVQPGTGGQAAETRLDGAGGDAPAATGPTLQGSAEADPALPATSPTASTLGQPRPTLLDRLIELWPQVVAALQQDLAGQGWQLATAPAQAGTGATGLPGSLLVTDLRQQPGAAAVQPSADLPAGLALPADAPASIRWLVDSGWLDTGGTAVTAAGTPAAPAQTAPVALPDGSMLEVSLTPLGAGRFGVTLTDGQGESLLNAQLTVLPAAQTAPATAVLPAAQTPAVFQALPGSGFAPPARLAPAAAPVLPVAVASPVLPAGLPAASGTVEPQTVPVQAGGPVSNWIAASERGSAASPAGAAAAAVPSPAAALPIRLAALPRRDDAVLAVSTADGAIRTAGPVQPQLAAALAGVTPARAVAIPVAPGGGAGRRQVALPAPSTNPTADPDSTLDPSNMAPLPAVTKVASGSTQATLQAVRSPQRSPGLKRTAAGSPDLAVLALDNAGIETGQLPLSPAQPAAGLNPHLLQFTLPSLPASGPAGLDYAELAQRVLGATQNAQQQGDGLYQAKLELNPPGLGRLYANIAVRDGQVAVQLAVASPAPRRQLEASLAGLKRSLEDAGLDVAGLRVVTLDTEQDGGGTGEQPSGGHPGEQRPAPAQFTAADSRLTTEFIDSLPAELWPLAAVQMRR